MPRKNASGIGRYLENFSRVVCRWTGGSSAFAMACAIVVIWLISGPFFGFSDTWQLVINTGTTIVTFLMVFLIQNTQNRDTEAMKIKLDELIRATQGANNRLLDLEELEDRELEAFRSSYESLAENARDCEPGDERSSGTPELSPPPQPPAG